MRNAGTHTKKQQTNRFSKISVSKKILKKETEDSDKKHSGCGLMTGYWLRQE